MRNALRRSRVEAISAFDATITIEKVRDEPVESPPTPGASEPTAARDSAKLPAHSGIEIKSLIATGGMGRVLLARQAALRRDIAVKTVRPDIVTPALSAALLEESQITGSLEHPNIIPVHSIGEDADGGPFLVMKRVNGVSWTDLIRDPRCPGWSRVGVRDGDRLAAHLSIFAAVCSAADFAHRHGVLHRDIKPDNVMVGEDGEVYLVDWGGATALDPSDPRFRKDKLQLVGTPFFIAPEMISDDGGPVDARTDVYLLGTTLHNALTGKVRHQARTMMEVFYLATMSKPASYGDEVPAALGEIINRACSRVPDDRYASAAALRDAVLDFLVHRSSITLSDRAWGKLDALDRRWREMNASTPKEDRAQLRRELLECEFAFAHALESSTRNTRASEGIRACALLVLRDDIAQRNLVGAEARLLDVGQCPPDVVAALETLRKEVADRDALVSRAEERERQEDWTQSAGFRAAFFVAMGLVAVVLWLWANDWRIRYLGGLTPRRLATTVGAVLALLSMLVAVMRKQLLTTRVNAQLVFGALTVVAGMFANLVANCWPVQYSATLVSTELIFCATGAALGGITVAPWLFWQVPIWLTGAFVVRAFPSIAGLVFVSSALLSLFVGVWRLHVHTRANAPRERAS